MISDAALVGLQAFVATSGSGNYRVADCAEQRNLAAQIKGYTPTREASAEA